MLINLHVKNFALIDDCEIDFKEGLNILTGETGAGKSIIIDSVGACLGARVSKEVIRDESAPAFVELVFSAEEGSVRKVLEDMDIPCDDQIIISRRIQKSGSVSKVNGETVTTSQARAISACLIDIHGQHEHQSLLSSAKHLEILDEYGKERIAPLKEKVSALFGEYSDCKRDLAECSMDDESRKREISFLEYEIKEIEEAGLKPGEDEDLESEYRRLSNGSRIMESLSEVYEITGTGRGSERPIGDAVGDAVRRLSSVADFDPAMSGLLESLNNIESLTSDFNREISSYMSGNEFSPEEFNRVTARLDLVNDLKAKFGNTIEKIMSSLEEKKGRLNDLNNLEEHMADLRSKLSRVEKELSAECAGLTEIRKAEALKLSNAIKESLIDLNFLQVEFEISFEETDYSARGRDAVHFLISTNPGEPVKELSAVASGGELSRIMLAIKTILAGSDDIPTLIFDEIDAGISGRTAQKVSEKLALVGKDHQVICITHLPQIASMASAHYLIEKRVVDAATVSEIRLLDHEESIMELARMLGGAEITDNVIANAREMKELAGKIGTR
ncbi:MAG: DNA repair protein RecN [Lachnospiraceae bacterium]|nr:DNA repair protein RecN [Lachnospiraceae bacterium]